MSLFIWFFQQPHFCWITYMTKDVVRCLVEISNIIISIFLVSLCALYLLLFDTWQEKTTAILITIGAVYAIVFIMNKLLPAKINLFIGIIDILLPPMMIVGAILCLAYFDMWPIKILSMFVWIVLIFWLPSFIDKIR